MGRATGSVGKPARSERARLIGGIHAAATRRGLDENTRREMQQSITGKTSCSEMSDNELRRVLEHLTGHAEARTKRPVPSEDRVKLCRKIYALLGDRPVSYAEGILKKMYGDQAPQVLEWAKPDQLHRVVAALEYDKRRHSK